MLDFRIYLDKEKPLEATAVPKLKDLIRRIRAENETGGKLLQAD